MVRFYFLISCFLIGSMGHTIQAQFTSNDVLFWTGEGSNEVVLLIDFNDGSTNDCYGFGYRFDGTVMANQMMENISSSYPYLNAEIVSGILNDIYLGNQEGLAGTPHYWMTFTLDLTSGWIANAGMGTDLVDGSWFACSYTGVDSLWNPLFLPENPIAAPPPIYEDDIKNWVGQGSMKSYFMVDFNNDSGTESFMWGYRHYGDKTGFDMLQEIAISDHYLEIDLAGGFLNDIIYGELEGIAGTPYYWSTYSGPNILSLSMNMGLGTSLVDNQIFACSYTDVDTAWNPINLPTAPVPAIISFVSEQILYWVGSGSKEAVFIIDFNNNDPYSESWVWGYRFDGNPTAEDMMNDIVNADLLLSIDLTGGFLNDIIYDGSEGIGGSPHYWSTFSGTSLLNWEMNMGIATSLEDGDWYGCSYTPTDAAWNPIFLPENPLPVEALNIPLAESNANTFDVYPNPFINRVSIQHSQLIETVSVYNTIGELVFKDNQLNSNHIELDLDNLIAGVYQIQILSQNEIIQQAIIKQ